MYTAVQEAALQKTRSSNESEGYIDIEGTLVSVQNKFLGKMIVDAAPLRVQSEIKQG